MIHILQKRIDCRVKRNILRIKITSALQNFKTILLVSTYTNPHQTLPFNVCQFFLFLRNSVRPFKYLVICIYNHDTLTIQIALKPICKNTFVCTQKYKYITCKRKNTSRSWKEKRIYLIYQRAQNWKVFSHYQLILIS